MQESIHKTTATTAANAAGDLCSCNITQVVPEYGFTEHSSCMFCKVIQTFFMINLHICSM
jgi:hypothetical protein